MAGCSSCGSPRCFRSNARRGPVHDAGGKRNCCEWSGALQQRLSRARAPRACKFLGRAARRLRETLSEAQSTSRSWCRHGCAGQARERQATTVPLELSGRSARAPRRGSRRDIATRAHAPRRPQPPTTTRSLCVRNSLAPLDSTAMHFQDDPTRGSSRPNQGPARPRDKYPRSPEGLAMGAGAHRERLTGNVMHKEPRRPRKEIKASGRRRRTGAGRCRASAACAQDNRGAIGPFDGHEESKAEVAKSYSLPGRSLRSSSTTSAST